MNQNLKQRRQLTSGLIMIDQKHRHDITGCRRSFIAALLALLTSLILFR